MNTGKRMVCGMTIDHYCFCNGLEDEYPSIEERKRLLERKVKELDQSEWKRWVPVLGLYRILKDIHTFDSMLLMEIRSAGYNVANIIYNFGAAAALGAGLYQAIK